MKALYSFKWSGSIHPQMQHHISQTHNPPLHHCANLKIANVFRLQQKVWHRERQIHEQEKMAKIGIATEQVS